IEESTVFLPLLLAALGREPFDTATLWGRGTADRLAVHASEIGEPPTERISVTREAGWESVRGKVEGGPVSSFGILPRGKAGPLCGLWKHPRLQTRLTIAFSGGQVYVVGRRELDNGSSR